MNFKWEQLLAKDGNNTLKLNGKLLYSKYKPIEEARKWIDREIDLSADSYLIIGLGLGYHLKALSEIIDSKKIVVYYFNEDEYCRFKTENGKSKWYIKNNIFIVNSIEGLVDVNSKVQVLITEAWLGALDREHPLYNILEIIKINQRSYNKFAPLMAENFKINTRDKKFENYPVRKNNIACLVSSGPSLDENVKWLKSKEKNIDIYVVGSALSTLLKKQITPYAAVITDAQKVTENQFTGLGYDGILYYLSTANYKIVMSHPGEKYLICQEGYSSSEKLAEQYQLPLLKTGGSVATVTFSLIEYLGYETIVLFGQDLAFFGNNTHAKSSSSNLEILNNNMVFREVESNDGRIINTMSNLLVYKYWFENKIKQTTMEVYNTSKKGAKIVGTKLLKDIKEFEKLIKSSQ